MLDLIRNPEKLSSITCDKNPSELSQVNTMKLKVQQRDYLDILRQSKEKGDVISDVDDVNHDVFAKMDISSQSKEEGDVISDVRDVGDVNDVSHDVSAKISARTYAQVTAHFVQLQENGKKFDSEIHQSQNIHVRYVNTKTLDTRSDKPLQNVQVIESSLETQHDGINVMYATRNNVNGTSDETSQKDNTDVLGQSKRNHINVMYATRNNVNGTSDETSQNLQANDKTNSDDLNVMIDKTNSDDFNVINDNVMNDNELKPTMHPGGI